MSEPGIARALTIAGSDSGGGAGIEADLKTFTALGVYGMVALTSVTAQDTVRVTAVYDLPASLVAKQIEVVAHDIGVDAAKTGMLSNAAIIEAVAECLVANAIRTVVVDPVMVAKGGDPLLQPSAIRALKKRLLPAALIVTPNIPEAGALSGMTIRGRQDIEAAARRIRDLGPRYVLIKGGHLRGSRAEDCLFDGNRFEAFAAPRIRTRNTHGTGCTYSAAIAAYLAKGLAVTDAVRHAKAYTTEAIRHSLKLGHGRGPLNHFWRLEPPNHP
jgi:hydroxymethylpyrimidine/phosphomethylpyrimidine kinase